MTDFNSINPDKNLNFNLGRKAKGGQPKPDANGDVPAGTDPYADLKMDPEKMLNLLAAQGRVNSQFQIENTSIERSINAFTQAVSPERHAEVTGLMGKVYEDEVGAKPHPTLLQDMVDDYLIGKPVIQNP